VATLTKYNLKGTAVGELNVDETFLDVEAHGQMIKDYIVALRANARQWSANTKGRTEVNHSNKKPWRQKGTGNARQGTLAAPQFKGGGVVFGPKPKFDQHIRINRKERRLVIRQLLADKIKENALVLVEDAAFNGELKEPKTRVIADFLKGKNIYGKRLLFVAESSGERGGHTLFKKSTRNLCRSAFILAPNLNGYDVMAAHGVVMTEAALKELTDLLK
jgi:large subunit ribosomal protein L4